MHNNYHHETFLQSSVVKTLNDTIRKTGEPLEGNCLYKHLSAFEEFEPGHRYENKQYLRENLFDIAKKSKNGMEVGFNGGHSAAIYFFANPLLKFLSFDICSHRYTEPCLNVLKNDFHYDIEFIKGDSTVTVPVYDVKDKYDFIHIDGGHGHNIAELDLKNCKKFADEHTLLVFDDANAPHIEHLLNTYVSTGFIQEINYAEEGLRPCFFHRIFRYNFP
jgi:predicted O-methyltransferase YrrM